MKKSLQIFIGIVLMQFFVGCVDDNYDLSDVDTTVKVSVNDLIIPVNIDAITLDNVLDLDAENSVEVIDGYYAIVREGDFTSQPVNVGAIYLQAPVIEPSLTTVRLSGASAVASSRAAEFSYELTNEHSEYRFASDFVSDFIVGIDYIGCRLELTVNIALTGLSSFVDRVTFNDVVLQIPKGLDLTADEGGKYDRESGLLTLPSRTVAGDVLTLNLKASGVNFAMAGGVYDYDNSTVSVLGTLFIKQGRASINAADIKTGITELPSELSLRTTYDLSDADVTSFSGSVKYDVSDAHLTDVDLSSLPDVLSQAGTDLKFVNPMVFLQITNPLQRYNMYARTGLNITAYHNDESKEYSIDNPYIQVGPGNADGVYNYCLSPQTPTISEPGFAEPEHVAFASLGDVLSGNGIPRSLTIMLDNPHMPVQRVADFKLGQDLGSLCGKYKFVAPLQFAEGSMITYTDRVDGWSSEDLDHMTITTLEINAVVSTDIPVGIEFTGYPIDVDGNKINNVDIVGANIAANASGQQVCIRITGTITNLDGIVFEAKAAAEAGGQALSPDMTLTLTDIRPKISGYYEKEL